MHLMCVLQLQQHGLKFDTISKLSSNDGMKNTKKIDVVEKLDIVDKMQLDIGVKKDIVYTVILIELDNEFH